MIDVSGDVIYLDGRPVAVIVIPEGTMRGRLMERLGLFDEFEPRKLIDDLHNLRDDISSIDAKPVKDVTEFVDGVLDHLDSIIAEIPVDT